MKKTTLILTGFAFLFMFCVGFSVAQEKATKEECVAKCKEAAALIKEIGVEAALAKMQDPKGPFVWKDSYVYAGDLDGVSLAHPMSPGMVGHNMRGMKDPNGKMFVTELLETAKNAGEGWIEYNWEKPDTKKISRKVTYVLRVPGQLMYVAAGIYED
jgi:signal transduction histidine kinase